jgi:serine/threonine protein kinase
MNKVKCTKCGFNNPENIENCLHCEAAIREQAFGQKIFDKLLPIFGNKKEINQPIKIVEKINDSDVYAFKSTSNEDFEVQRFLGKGGYCNVYLVERVGDKRLFAIKLLRLWEITQKREDVETRFWFEYRMAQTKSEYLVQVFGKGELKGNPFYVMEYCDGGSLAQKISANWTDLKLRVLATDILKGLQDIHSQKAVHRDLKPNNVVFHEGKTKLIDFGISGKNNIRMTQKSEVLGTDVYMAPEWIISSQKEIFTRVPTVDIFSFGVLMFEVISGGYFPYGLPPDSSSKVNYSLDLVSYFDKVLKNLWENLDTFRQNSRISEFWASIIERCLQSDPKNRFQSVSEILMLIGEIDLSNYCSVCHYEILNQREGLCEKCGSYLLQGKWYLRVVNGKEINKLYELDSLLENNGIATIGRLVDYDIDKKNDIEVVDFDNMNTISRHHGTIEKSTKTGMWFIRDGQWRVNSEGKFVWQLSKNGLFVNTSRADSMGIPFFPNDTITMGNTTLKVEFDSFKQLVLL